MRCNKCREETEPNKNCEWYCSKCGEVYENE